MSMSKEFRKELKQLRNLYKTDFAERMVTNTNKILNNGSAQAVKELATLLHKNGFILTEIEEHRTGSLIEGNQRIQLDINISSLDELSEDFISYYRDNVGKIFCSERHSSVNHNPTPVTSNGFTTTYTFVGGKNYHVGSEYKYKLKLSRKITTHNSSTVVGELLGKLYNVLNDNAFEIE